MNYKELGRRVRELRRQQNLTQAELAEKIGVSTSFVGHIERGSRVISLETFANLCAALEAEPNDLLYAGGNVRPPAGQLTGEQRQQLHALLQYACQLVCKEPSSSPC